MHRILLCFALLLSAAFAPSPARAAQCTEITSVGTTITGPGNFCLGNDLDAGTTTGSFINISVDNVVLDCRGYALRNLSTNPSGNAYGVIVVNRKNIHIRNCRITGGFAAGIYAYQDNGLANANRNIKITGNDVSGTYWYGIFAYGTDIEVSDNRVSDIGGRASFAMGIRVGASNVPGEGRLHVVRDNIVSNVVSPVNHAYGIYANNTQYSEFTGNNITGIRSVVYIDNWFGYGIRLAAGGYARVADNHIAGDGYSVGIQATATDACFHNYLRVDTSTVGCVTTPGNY
jgi:parallel beta-helix repeat protein